jgi:hypothetical protein
MHLRPWVLVQVARVPLDCVLAQVDDELVPGQFALTPVAFVDYVALHGMPLRNQQDAGPVVYLPRFVRLSSSPMDVGWIVGWDDEAQQFVVAEGHSPDPSVGSAAVWTRERGSIPSGCCLVPPSQIVDVAGPQVLARLEAIKAYLTSEASLAGGANRPVAGEWVGWGGLGWAGVGWGGLGWAGVGWGVLPDPRAHVALLCVPVQQRCASRVSIFRRPEPCARRMCTLSSSLTALGGAWEGERSGPTR